MSRFAVSACAALALAIIPGCGEKSDSFQAYDQAPASDGSHGGHSHAHEVGPHGGVIVELAEDHSVHGEVVFEEGSGVLTFFVLGSDLKTPAPADEIKFEVEDDTSETELPVTPSPLEGETAESCSRFTVDVSGLKDLKSVEDLHAHVHVKIGDKELEGGLEHDHDHDHDHDKDAADHHDDEAGHEHDKK